MSDVESVCSSDSEVLAAQKRRENDFEEAREDDAVEEDHGEPLTEERVQETRQFIEKHRAAYSALPELKYACKRSTGVSPLNISLDAPALRQGHGTSTTDNGAARPATTRREQPYMDLRQPAGPLDFTKDEQQRVLGGAVRALRVWKRRFASDLEHPKAKWAACVMDPMLQALGSLTNPETLEQLAKLSERLSRYVGTSETRFQEQLAGVEAGLRLLRDFAADKDAGRELLHRLAGHHCDQATSAAMVCCVACARVILELASWKDVGGGAAAVKNAATIAKEAALSKAVTRNLPTTHHRAAPPFKRQRTEEKEKPSAKPRFPVAETAPRAAKPSGPRERRKQG